MRPRQHPSGAPDLAWHRQVRRGARLVPQHREHAFRQRDRQLAVASPGGGTAGQHARREEFRYLQAADQRWRVEIIDQLGHVPALRRDNQPRG
jgi:hypothetical protein